MYKEPINSSALCRPSRHRPFKRYGASKNGFSLLELLLSIALAAILVVAIHQNLTVTMMAAYSANARMRCLVTANNILEQAQATPGTFTEILNQIVTGNIANFSQPYLIPASYSAGGILGNVKALISTTSIRLDIGSDETSATVAVILVTEDMHNGQANLQAFRSPL